jgi:hypothetical protein
MNKTMVTLAALNLIACGGAELETEQVEIGQVDAA